MDPSDRIDANRGIIYMAPEFLVAVLDLGRDHSILDVYLDEGGRIAIMVDGPLMPAWKVGEMCRQVTPIFRRKDYNLAEIRVEP